MGNAQNTPEGDKGMSRWTIAWIMVCFCSWCIYQEIRSLVQTKRNKRKEI